MIAQIRAVTWQLARGFEWQVGDMLVLDNYAVAHARMSYLGEREMFIAMLNT
eukprot:SAG22_NODE_7177_length_767_cov_0.932635_2_plen_52_part_00